MALPVMATAVCTGCSTVPRSLLDTASVYDLSRRQTFHHVRLPFLLPFVQDGMLSSFGMTWKVTVAGEVLSLPRLGAGQLLYTAQVHLESADLLAVTLAVVLLSFLFEKTAALLFQLLRTQVEQGRRRAASDAAKGSATRPEGQEQTLKLGLPPALSVSDFSAVRAGRELYRNFSLELAPSSSTALVAPSGAGKTTLLDFTASLLGKEDGSFSGRITSSGGKGTDIGRPQISYIFQEPRLFPACTVLENVMLPLLHSTDRNAAKERALRFIRECGLESKAAAFPGELSGGERQRAALARAFAFPSPLMLLDEAFQGQDLAQKVSLMDLYGRLLAECPRTVLFVTHDIREALACCSRILVLQGSPLHVELDEQLAPCTASVANCYLSPDRERRALEERIARILLN
jgi:ABC-type nitrate/sulfonate/bicarbonate transport system ATPase subunit